MNRQIVQLRLSVILAAVLLPATVAIAVTKNSTVVSGTALWSTSNNWSPFGAPGANDAVNIVFNNGIARTVTYDVVAAPSIGLLTINLTNGSGAATSTLSLPSNNSLITDGIIVGGYDGTNPTTGGSGTINQSAGTVTTNSVVGDLVLGWGAGSSGTYTLSAGSIVNNLNEYVGLSGTGTFNQTAGSNTINASAAGFFSLGHNAGSMGAYNLSGVGALSTAADQYIGNSGTGTFNQTGGTNTISGAGHSLYIGRNNSGNGTYTLSGGGLLSVGGGGNLIVGGSAVGTPGGTASLNVNAASVNITGEGSVLAVNTGGSLNINSGATVNVANLTRTGSGTINLAGGLLTIDGGTFNNGATGLTTTNGSLSFLNNATTSNLTFLNVAQGGSGALNVLSGATPTFARSDIGSLLNSNGTAVVGGIGSTLTSSNLGVGTNGGTGTLIVNSGGSVIQSADLTTHYIYAGFAGGNGTINVNAGGSITSVRTFIGAQLGATGTANIAGSWTNASTFEVGGFDGGLFGASGTVNVNSGGSLNAGTVLSVYSPGRVNVNVGGQVTVNTIAMSGGVFNVNAGGHVSANAVVFTAGAFNLVGGTLNLPAFTPPTGGTFNFNSGTVAFTGDWSAATGQISDLLGSGANLTNGKTIQVAGVTTLQSALTLNGGTLRTGSITGLGSLALDSGTLDLTNSSLTIGAAGPFGSLVTVGPGLNLRVSGPGRLLTISSDGMLNLTGGTAAGTSIANAGEIAFGSPVAALGLPGQALTNTGRLSGPGRVNASLANNANGRIISDANSRLVFTGATNNNNSNGTIEMSGGTIEFTGTLNNNAGGQISGRGIFRGSSANTSGTGLVNAGAVAFSGGFSDVHGKVNNVAGGQILTVGGGTTTFHDNVIHNGTEIRTAPGSRSVFLGAVSGAGSFTGTGTNEFHGDIRPGNSAAAIQFAGDVSLGAESTLQIEIGGTTPGNLYDQIVVAGDFALDGSLNVSLINDFQPTIGQSFNILDWLGTRTGTFSSLTLPTLPGLGWNISQLYNTGVLSLVAAGLRGDYNDNGSVDAADYVVWRKNNNTAITLPNDSTTGTSPEDYDVWRSYFGQTAGSGAGGSADAAIPEPATLFLVLVGILSMCFGRRASAS